MQTKPLFEVKWRLEPDNLKGYPNHSPSMALGLGAAATALAGTSVLFGWIFGIDALTRVVQGMAAMNPWTAVCFILIGLALLARRWPRSAPIRTLGIVAALIPAISGALKLTEILFHFDTGIDTLLFPEALANDVSGLPNRMAPNTALNFVLAGTAVLLIHSEDEKNIVLAQLFALMILVLSGAALLGYAYGAATLYEVISFIPMAAHTAAAFIVLSVSIISANPRSGVAAILTAPGSAGAMARVLFPAVIFVPIGLGWLQIIGQKIGLYGPEAGAAFLVLANILMLCAVVWLSTEQLRKSDAARQQTENALHAAKQLAESSSAAKTEFLASMSHEIRTPLNGIVGYTDLLLDQDLKPEQRRYLERIQFAGAALLTVVNDILDFSKIEAGQITLQPHAFSLKALVDNTVSIIAETANRKGLVLKVQLDPELPVALVGDEARLRQILLNLLNNALKFTQRGSIVLRAEWDASSSRDRISFSVQDTGIGIPQDQRKHLFHRFYQIDHSSTRDVGGTGLGLAISKRLVGLMGGEIGFESEEGKGSIFWFKVPLPRAEESAIAAQLTGASAIASISGRILLVEDLEHNRDLARTILVSAGHEVDTAENGEQAVAAVQTKAYDLVLMDIQMPVMDGVTATKMIRELDHSARNIPIIAMTANVLPQQVAAFGEAGMNDHVGKPFKKAELFQKVNTWLQRS